MIEQIENVDPRFPSNIRVRGSRRVPIDASLRVNMNEPKFDPKSWHWNQNIYFMLEKHVLGTNSEKAEFRFCPTNTMLFGNFRHQRFRRLAVQEILRQLPKDAPRGVNMNETNFSSWSWIWNQNLQNKFENFTNSPNSGMAAFRYRLSFGAIVLLN